MKKSFLSLFVTSLFASVPPVMAEEITYTGNGTDLKPAPLWAGYSGSSLYPGTEDNPGASGNTVTIDYDPDADDAIHPNNVVGGFSQSDASGNTVNMRNGQIGPFPNYTYLAGGFASSSALTPTASGNIVNLYGGNVISDSYSFIYGGYAYFYSTEATATATASNNIVNISGGNVSSGGGNDIYGGYTYSYLGPATSIGNTVNISGGTVDGTSISIYGSYAYSSSFSAENAATATASNSTVNISSGSFNASNSSGNGLNGIYGGRVYSAWGTAEASHNTVSITGGSFDASSSYSTGSNNEIYGGYAYAYHGEAATASYNTVSITGGNFNADRYNIIYGSYASSDSGTATATHNTVIIGSEADIGDNAQIWGGYGISGDESSNLFTGNRLFIAGQRTVTSIGNFEYLNFTLPASISSGDTLITATGDVTLNAGAPSGSNTASTVESISVESGSSLSVGDTVTLIQAEGNMEGALANTSLSAASDSFAFSTEWDLAMTTGEGGSLTATLAGYDLNPQTHAFLSGRVAQTSLLGQGADLIAGQGLSSLHESIRTGKQLFFAMQGGSNRYQTGSGIDMDSFALIAGAAWGTRINPDTEAAIGAFVEAGTGSYSSSNSFTGMGSVRGSGNTDFVGAGLLGYVEWANGLYADASVRAGRVESDLSTNAVHGGSAGGYDEVSGMYVGAHAGIGYRLAMTKASTLDMYTRYFYTHMEGDTATILGDKYRFDSSDSHRWRTGLRYGYSTGSIMPYAGVAYEYEFDGKAGGSVAGYRLEETDMGGSTWVGEIGLAWMPNENTRLNVALEGFAGQRDGVMGNVRFNYRF